jgi:DNA-binding NarL/FixJ family response regulator
MKLLLVDDEPRVMSALRRVVQRVGEDVTVVGVPDAAAAERTLRTDSVFDLVLLSVAPDEPGGCDGLADMRMRYPALPVVALSTSERTTDVIRLVELGAMGFVPKRADGEELFAALAMVISGGVYIPPIALGLLPGAAPQEPDTVPSVMRHALPGAPAAPTGPVPLGPEPAAAVPTAEAGGGLPRHPSLQGLGLTPRQADVLALLLKGLPNKLIAREMNLAVDTVKDHVAAVLRALNVTSRTQAVLTVSQMNLTAPGSGWRAGPDADAARRNAGG